VLGGGRHHRKRLLLALEQWIPDIRTETRIYVHIYIKYDMFVCTKHENTTCTYIPGRCSARWRPPSPRAPPPRPQTQGRGRGAAPSTRPPVLGLGFWFRGYSPRKNSFFSTVNICVVIRELLMLNIASNALQNNAQHKDFRLRVQDACLRVS
jgi:hypothetical protein